MILTLGVAAFLSWRIDELWPFLLAFLMYFLIGILTQQKSEVGIVLWSPIMVYLCIVFYYSTKIAMNEVHFYVDMVEKLREIIIYGSISLTSIPFIYIYNKVYASK